MLLADINDIDGAFTNGDSFSVELADDAIDAEDENGDDVDDVTGSADSEDLSFVSSGIMIAKGADDTATVLTNTPDSSSDDQGQFTINFDVTAFEDTVYIALTGAIGTSTDPATAGVYAYVENTSNVAVFTGTTTVGEVTRVSGGSTTSDGLYARINPGQTARMSMIVRHDAAATGNFRAQLHAVNFNDTQAAGDTQQLSVPEGDYQTPSVQVLN